MLPAGCIELPKVMVPSPGSPVALEINHMLLKARLYLELSAFPQAAQEMPCVHSVSVVRGLYDSGLRLAFLVELSI